MASTWAGLPWSTESCSATAGLRGWRGAQTTSVPPAPGAGRSPRTWVWQALKVALLMMLHCFWAHGLRNGLAVQGSLGARASGHDGENFQLLPNSSTSPTTDWLRVVRSLRALSSKFPHSPQTLPCRQTDMQMAAAAGGRRKGPLTPSSPRLPQDSPRSSPSQCGGGPGCGPLGAGVSWSRGYRRHSVAATGHPQRQARVVIPDAPTAQSGSEVSAGQGLPGVRWLIWWLHPYGTRVHATKTVWGRGDQGLG